MAYKVTEEGRTVKLGAKAREAGGAAMRGTDNAEIEANAAARYADIHGHVDTLEAAVAALPDYSYHSFMLFSWLRDGGTITRDNINTTYVTITGLNRLALPPTSIRFVMCAHGNEGASSKRMRIYNVTDAVALMEETWIDVSYKTQTSPWAIVTDEKEYRFEWRGGSATEDMILYYIIIEARYLT